MLRYLIKFNDFGIPSWGVMAVIAIFVGVYLAERRAIKYGIQKGIINDLSMVIIISGVVGARIFYVIQEWNYYSEHLDEIIKVWQGGLIWYGGFILGFIFGIIFIKVKKIGILRCMDILTPSIALGLAIARIGCFLNGCCYGKETNFFIQIKFPSDSPAGWQFGNNAVQPTQIYSAIGNLFIFLLILKLEKTNKFKNKLFFLFLIFYSIFRFLIDFIRYYDSWCYIGKFTHNQIISLVILFIGIVLTVKKW